MKRSQARELAMRLCFALSENPGSPQELLSQTFDNDYYKSLYDEDELYMVKPSKKQLDYITHIVTSVWEHSAELDDYIERYSVGWKFGRLARMAVAIMNVAMFEVLYMPDVPDGVAINEAVEIAKKYEPSETVSFINGVLGSFVSKEKI